MPELPEVETIKSDLNTLLSGKAILSVTINLAKQVGSNKNIFSKKIKGAKVISVKRRAKVLLASLDNEYTLAFHLKMTGQLIYRDKSGKVSGGGHPINHNLQELPNKYSHVIFNFKDGSRLFFNDTRQFGWVKLLSQKDLEKIDSSFGPEPLSKEFTPENFYSIIHRRKKPIKVLLMDPHEVAGIGNIYAMESLFCAGIRPIRNSSKITKKESQKLFDCLQNILKLAISKKGTSSDSYVDAFGRQGSMDKFLKVYLRDGLECLTCKSKLKSIKQASRSTVYCSSCQK